MIAQTQFYVAEVEDPEWRKQISVLSEDDLLLYKLMCTADGDNSQIATMIANINRYIVNGVIAAKHSASGTACQQAADKARNFKIAKQLNKTVSVEKVPEALHLLKKYITWELNDL